MRDIIYYKTATGEITGGDIFEDDALTADITDQMDADESYMDGEADADRDYVDITVPIVPVIVARPTIVDYSQIQVVADNTVTVDFALPTGTTVTFRGVETISTAGEHFQFKSNGAGGTYEFLIDPPFPYVGVFPLQVVVYAV